jgi:hypothetical protein
VLLRDQRQQDSDDVIATTKGLYDEPLSFDAKCSESQFQGAAKKSHQRFGGGKIRCHLVRECSIACLSYVEFQHSDEVFSL